MQRRGGPRGSDRLWLELRRTAAGIPSPFRLENTLLSEEDMLQEHSIVHTILRKYFRPLTVAVVASALLLVGHAAWAQEGPVRLLKTIPIPGTDANPTAPAPNGKLYSFDISFVDELTQTYYLADRSNVAVDVVDAKTAAFIGQISVSPPFAGVVSTSDCQAKGGTTC